MRKAIFVGVLLLSCASMAYAADSVSGRKQLCQAGTLYGTIAPLFDDVATRDALKKRVRNSNFCTDDRVTLGPLGQIQEATACICPKGESDEENLKMLEGIGCSEGQREPYVTISIKKSITGCVVDDVVISKCAKDPKQAYEDACKSGIATPGSVAGDADEAVEIERAWDLHDLPALNVPDASDATMQALTAAGVSRERAQSLMSENPQSAQEYIRALASGNETEIKAQAAKLQIDPNLSNNIRTLGVSQPPRPDPTEPPAPAVDHNAVATRNRFQSSDPASAWSGEFPTQCGIPGVAGLIMGPESGCGRVTRNPRADVRGPYQFLCGTWNTYAQNTGNSQYACSCTSGGYYAGECSAVDDPHIGAQIVNAQYDRYRIQYSEYCSSISQRWETCAYAIHFAGEAGFTRLVQTYLANPSTPLDPGTVGVIFGSGAYVANREVFAQAGTVGGLFAFMEAKLRGTGVVTSTVFGPTGASVNTGYTLNPYSGQLFTGTTGPAPSQTPVVMSPFANASLFSGFRAQQSQAPVQYAPAPLPMPMGALPPRAQVSLTIVPKIGKVGDAFTVSWSSSAINTTSPCTLSIPGSSMVPVSFAGSQSVKIKKAAEYSIVFTCRALDGTFVSAKESVQVQ